MASIAMFIVTVPARLLPVSKAKGDVSSTDVEATSVDSGALSVGKPRTFAKEVREFIIDQPDCEFISEEPALNGKAWWVSFCFSCKEGSAEACIAGLHKLGVGDTDEGKGMIHVLPVSIQRIGSRPKTCGRPASLPYSAPGVSPAPTPQTTPIITPGLRKSAGTIAENVATDEIQPQPTTTTSLDQDEDYGDAEVEDDDDRLRAEFEAELNESKRKTHGFKQAHSNFQDTVKSRVAVDAVIKIAESGAEFSFDYVMLILIAGSIACTGLVTNNVVTIVASMLVSPLMGPILAVTFGSVISDHALVKRGVFSECIGLLMCVFVGFVGGLCSAPCNGDTWPTEEMYTRSVVSALWIGVAVAIPSGMGAALSILGSNTSSLVGVAISASLLPPAVNCGILLAAGALRNTGWITNAQENLPEDYPTRTLIGGALISFCLTVVNIFCIWIAAYIMFEIKEVKSGSTFWQKHVKNTREYNKAARKNPSMADIHRRALESAKRKTSSINFHMSPLEKLKASWKD